MPVEEVQGRMKHTPTCRTPQGVTMGVIPGYGHNCPQLVSLGETVDAGSSHVGS